MIGDEKRLWYSFAGGEIDEGMLGRVDLPRYNTSLKLCKNFRVKPQGPIENRTGSQFVRAAGDSTRRVRIRPFVRSDGQALILEFGHQYVRFHKNGGTVLAATALQTVTSVSPNTGPDTTQTTFTVAGHGYSNGDTVVLSGFTTSLGYLGGQAYIDQFMNVDLLVANATTDTFQLTTTLGSTVRLAVGLSFGDVLSPGQVQESTAAPYTVATPYTGDDVFDLVLAQDVDTVTITHPAYQQRELTRSADNSWTLTTLSFDVTIAGPSVAAVVNGPSAGSNPLSLHLHSDCCRQRRGDRRRQYRQRK